MAAPVLSRVIDVPAMTFAAEVIKVGVCGGFDVENAAVIESILARGSVGIGHRLEIITRLVVAGPIPAMHDIIRTYVRTIQMSVLAIAASADAEGAVRIIIQIEITVVIQPGISNLQSGTVCRIAVFYIQVSVCPQVANGKVICGFTVNDSSLNDPLLAIASA